MTNFLTRNSTLQRQLRLLILLRVVDSATTVFNILVMGQVETMLASGLLISWLGVAGAMILLTVIVGILVVILERVATEQHHWILCVSNSLYLLLLGSNFLAAVLAAFTLLRGYLMWLS